MKYIMKQFLFFFIIFFSMFQVYCDNDNMFLPMDFDSQSQFREFREVFHGIDAQTIMHPYGGLNVERCDVNDSGSLDIIDALLIAQYYVGLIQVFPTSTPCAGEFSGDGIVNIVDALLVAQYYVSLMVVNGKPSYFESSELEKTLPVLEIRNFQATIIHETKESEINRIIIDGDYMYQISDSRLIISRNQPPAYAEIINIVELDTAGIRYSSLAKYGNKLILLGSYRYQMEFSNPYFEPNDNPCYTVPDTGTSFYNITAAIIYDVTDKKNIIKERTIELDGTFLSINKSGNILYLVSTRSLSNDDPPKYKDTLFDDNFIMLDYNQIQYIPVRTKPYYLNIAAIDLADTGNKLQVNSYIVPSFNLHTSEKNLYIVYQIDNNQIDDKYNSLSWFPEIHYDNNNTYISKLELNNLNMAIKETGSVHGQVLNKYSMSEYDTYFRIATNSEKSNTSHVYILDTEMNIYSTLQNIVIDPDVYAVRFIGDKGYILPSSRSYPLNVLDLSTPQDPVLLGEMQLTGYNNALHTYDENHIICIGRETSDINGFTWDQGMKLALFNIADITNPILLHEEVIGHRGTRSGAEYHHRLFLLSLQKDILVIPVSLCEHESKPPINSIGRTIFQGVYIYDLTKETGFNLQGQITHQTGIGTFSYYQGINYSIILGDALYTISPEKIQLNSLDSLEMIKELFY